MRLRPVILALLALLALVAGLALLGPRDRAPDHAPMRGPSQRADPPVRGEIPAELAQALGPMDEVLPMHKAVRAASRRFHGRVLDITLIAPKDPAAAAPLVYRIRLLTPARDVLDIRMDALTGRFLEIRGADLAAARRTGRKTRKDDD